MKTTTLIGAAIATLLLSWQASGAEPLSLICEHDPSTTGHEGYLAAPVKFHIDLDRGIVEMGYSGGGTISSTTDTRMNALPAKVTISDTVIWWNLSNSIGFLFKGSIDRETGLAQADWVGVPRDDSGPHFFSGKCQRATQKF